MKVTDNEEMISAVHENKVSNTNVKDQNCDREVVCLTAFYRGRRNPYGSPCGTDAQVTTLFLKRGKVSMHDMGGILL